MILRIEHEVKKVRCNLMLLPLGYYKNQHLVDAEIGTVLQTIDNPPQEIVLLARTVVSYQSEMAAFLSRLIYNKPFSEIYEAMVCNWRKEMKDGNVLVICYKKNKTELNIMKKREEIQIEKDKLIDQIVAMTDPIKGVSKENKKAVIKLKAKREHCDSLLFYLDTNPDPEFLKKQLEGYEEMLILIQHSAEAHFRNSMGIFGYDAYNGDKVMAIKHYKKEAGVSDIKKRIKCLKELLNGN